MNMTKKFVHDRKDHTDEHEQWNLTEIVSDFHSMLLQDLINYGVFIP